MRSEEEVTRAIQRYSDTVKRICLVHLKNSADTEDIFQNVFLKYALSSAVFENPEHEKAWFIRVTMNACKDLLKSFFRNHMVPLDQVVEQAIDPEDQRSEVLQAVLKLPEKYRRVVYLHYYEGYTAPQIGKLLNKNVNTIYTLLTRARQLLKNDLGGEYDAS
jgi:RNA polymerase sigma factor (sigma-70 family)